MQSDFIARIEQIDHLIRIKGTGAPHELAARLGISRRCLYDYINKMKERGAPIKYDTYRSTFFYAEEGNFKVIFSFCKERIANELRGVAGYSSLIFVSYLLNP